MKQRHCKDFSFFFIPISLFVFSTWAQATDTNAVSQQGVSMSSGGRQLSSDEVKEVYRIPDEIAPGPFATDWKSFTPDKLKSEPDWWRDAKIGVWFHWGPQSMGRNGDWYARFLYQQGGGRRGTANNISMYDAHLKRFGHPSEFGYMDVLNAWKARDFDPKKLMDLYAASGARYILVQGAHHDNFDLWNSKFQPWNSVNVGPHRDLVGEMFKEARSHGMRAGMAFHADYSLWWYQPAFGSDQMGPKAAVPYDAATRTKEQGKGQWWDGLDPKDLYGIDLKEESIPGQDIRKGFMTPVNQLFVHEDTREFAKWYALKWFRRLKQFIDDYNPDFIYTDGYEPFSGRGTAKGVISDATVKVVAHMYNKNYAKNNGKVDCMAIIKGGPHVPGVASPHEGGYDGPIIRSPWVWENTCGEWFFEENTKYSSRGMIMQMIEAICRDGNFNYAIALTPDGTLEPGGEKMWHDFGDFMRINGDAVYGSRAWKVLGEGRMKSDPNKPNSKPSLILFPRLASAETQNTFPFTTEDMRFTQGKDGNLYSFVMTVPKPGETITIKSMGTDAKLLDKQIADVALLGVTDKPEWKQESYGLVITCPKMMPLQFASVFKISLK
jgi:alpha-L-fucosidase